MDIEIRRLTPALLDDYLNFFDHTPHSTGKAEHRCYCVCWSAETCEGRDFSTAEKRREIAAEYVSGGRIQGYLAYLEGRAIGWVNANAKADCYECISWRMFMGDIPRDDAWVKAVFCFAVAPDMRGKGVAGKLLRRVCEDAEKEGFDCVEAYPNREFKNTEDDFMGPVSLFQKQGFQWLCDAGGRCVYRKTFVGRAEQTAE